MAAPLNRNVISRYGLFWPITTHPVSIELDMIRKGGRIKRKSGVVVGEGLFFHWCAAIKLLWPHIKLHKWNLLIIEKYLEYRTIGIIGPASSGKTNTGGASQTQPQADAQVGADSQQISSVPAGDAVAVQAVVPYLQPPSTPAVDSAGCWIWRCSSLRWRVAMRPAGFADSASRSRAAPSGWQPVWGGTA